MLFNLATILDTDADNAWRLIKKPSTFLFVARGLLGVSGSRNWPDEWCAGQTINTRLWLFHLLPAWRHEIRVLSLDDSSRVIKTAEKGGLVQTWNHALLVEPISADRCRYTDKLDVDAGILNLLVWLFLQTFFRYRQMRLRKLARSIVSSPRS